MFLGAYRFDGDPADLTPAYDRLVASIPAGMIELQVCVVVEGGITVFDTCPSRAVFDEFSTSDGFTAAVEAAGLPTPTIEPLGEVHGVITPSTS